MSKDIDLTTNYWRKQVLHLRSQLEIQRGEIGQLKMNLDILRNRILSLERRKNPTHVNPYDASRGGAILINKRRTPR